MIRPLLALLLLGMAAAAPSPQRPPALPICHVVATWRPLGWSARLSGDPEQAFRTVTLKAPLCPLNTQARIIFSTESGPRPLVDAIYVGGLSPSVAISGVPWWWIPQFLSASGKAAYPIPYTREP